MPNSDPWRSRARTQISLAVCLSVVLVALASPAAADAAQKKAFWGPVRVNGVSQFPIYRDLGVGIYQIQVHWDSVAPVRPRHPTDPADPAYRWPDEVSDAVQQGRRYGIRVSIMVIGAPRWANGGRPWNWAPRRPVDFAHFTTAAARRYPSVKLWMIWGEPSRQPNFQPLTPTLNPRRLNRRQAAAPRLYARILDAAYGALKRVRRRNLVIGGNTFTSGTPLSISPFAWIRYMRLPDGSRPRMDLYGHNPFSARPPDFRNPPLCCGAADFSDLPRLARHIDRYLSRSRRQRIPLFLSEFTIPTGATDQEFNFSTSRKTQARRIRVALRYVRGWSRIYTFGWIHLYDDPPRSNGGLLDSRGHKKPGYFAFKNG